MMINEHYKHTNYPTQIHRNKFLKANLKRTRASTKQENLWNMHLVKSAIVFNIIFKFKQRLYHYRIFFHSVRVLLVRKNSEICYLSVLFTELPFRLGFTL